MKIGMLFPGYGSQFVGMGKELYDESRIIQEYFEEASNCLDINFVKLCFASSEIELAKTSNAYTATFLVSTAIFALLKQEGIEPDMVAGYNLGEYAAIFAGGGFSLPDGLYLLSKYAHFYQEALQDLNVDVLHVSGISTKKLSDICLKSSTGDSVVQIAIYNASTEHVVAGHMQAVERVRELLAQYEDVVTQELSEEVGLHSSLMDHVVDHFTIYLEKVDFKDLPIPLVNNVAGKIVKKGQEVKAGIIDHSNHPVLWDKVLNKFVDCDVLIEVGPGTMLSSLVKEKYPDKIITSINKWSDIDELKKLITYHKGEGKP